MDMTDISPDEVVFFEWGFAQINSTIVFTWLTMILLVGGSWLITRKLSTGTTMSRWQNLLEIIVDFTRRQITEISGQPPNIYLPFIGTLFIFICTANILMMIPGYTAPTASLSTTAGLAICVFFAVPIYGVVQDGVVSYLKQYVKPTPFMLPFNIIGELSRTLALAVRLFGNVMSGTKIAAILMAVIPLIFPIVMQVLGLLTGVIQAYIFAILAMVYISSGTRARRKTETQENGEEQPAVG